MKTIAAQHAQLAKVAGISPSSRPLPPKTAGNAGPPRTPEHVNLTHKVTTQKALNSKAARKPRG